SRLRGAMGDFDAPQAEDCLHLTVWTPAADARRRPVVVWLHGGAWQSGGGALDWYNGARLAARGDVVVVAVNYRLAALGWLHVPGETANVGLLDQECAIDWVLDNIQDLGGDPARVTLMGQSAGASSICAMLARRPRFGRAILQSAALGRGFRSSAQAAALGQAFLAAAGADTLEHARALPVERLLAAQQAPAVIAALQAESSRRSLFGPVLDGQVLPADIAPALRQAAGRADVLVSYTRDEMAAFPGGDGPDCAAASEAVFGAPSRQWAADAAAQGRQAWLARFDVAPTTRFQACHCIELPFVFDTLAAFADAPMLQGLAPTQAAALAQTTQRAWIAFIRGETPAWPAAPHLERLA
ncbi:carboxylesterase family protein, partial [Achromobacter insuavis]|uniref:carboxylesterase family protein n=6 Tax=Alcaligenaceae TaxID=506 RepID=UPI00359FD5AB